MSENEQKTGASTAASTAAFGAVPATVSGLRALLAEGMLDGIRVMHDTRGDFNRLYGQGTVCLG